MSLKGVSIIQYATAGLVLILAAVLGYGSYVAWRSYSRTTLAVQQYDSGSYGPAHKAISSITGTGASGDPRFVAFEAHLLGLQGYHDKAASLLAESDLRHEGVVKLALATEKLFASPVPGPEVPEHIALLEEASETCMYPDVMVALGGAYLLSAELEKADAVLKAVSEDAGRLTFDGLLALYANLGRLRSAQFEYELSAQNYKKLIEILPLRKVPPLSGAREEARLCGERGLAFACVAWLMDEKVKSSGRRAAVEYVTGMLDERQAGASSMKRRWELRDYRYLIFNALGLAQWKEKAYDSADRYFSQSLKEAGRTRDIDRTQAKQVIAFNRALCAAEKTEKSMIPGSGDRSGFNAVAKALADAGAQTTLPARQRYAAYNLSARYYFEAGNKRRTESALKEAVKLMEGESTALVNLAVFCDRVGRAAEALKYYEQALKIENLSRRAEIEKRVQKLKE